MRLMGFNFNKINVEKFSSQQKDIKLNNSINIDSIEKADQKFIKLKEDLFNISFTYSIFYEPNIAKLEFKGNMLLAIEPKLSKDLLKQWSNKQIPEDIQTVLFNIILRKSTIRALQFEEDMNLPHHIPLPSVKPKKTENQ